MITKTIVAILVVIFFLFMLLAFFIGTKESFYPGFNSFAMRNYDSRFNEVIKGGCLTDETCNLGTDYRLNIT